MAEQQIFLHPLVIVNISDQFTRAVMKEKEPRVYGGIVGRQQGKRIEILHSFEFLLDENKQVNSTYILQRGRQFYRVFEGMDVLGWYVTGNTTAPRDEDMEVHQQIESLTDLVQGDTFGDTTQINFSESPLLLCLNIAPAEKSRDLPIGIYENSLSIIEGKPKSSFKAVNFTIQTTEIERIGVDHVANISRPGASLLQGHLSSMHSAIKMLSSRISLLRRYVEEVKAGKLPADPAVMRDINSICRQLPAINSNEFKVEFLSEYNDALLLTYMATLTKASVATVDMLEKFNNTYDRQGRGHRGMIF
jgi:COP9 signalosome complex subunit 6